MGNVIGIIGGSGLYDMEGLTGVQELFPKTPFGETSDAVVKGTLGETTLYFLPRHGRGHPLLPSEVPYRANIWALKHLGCERVLSVSAVGSMKEEIAPGHMVIPDQFIDWTRTRKSTFFGEGCVAHVSYGDPVCPHLGDALEAACKEVGVTVHRGGVYLCMEGPQFSTKAESKLYRNWGVSVIGMTNATEAKLAREAELSYATLALSTDYDCWHEGHDAVRVEDVIKILTQNVSNARKILQAVIPKIGSVAEVPVPASMAHAILTAPEKIPPATREKLNLIIGRYI